MCYIVPQRVKKPSDYFAVNSILSLDAILLSPFMCVYVAIIATILLTILRHVDSAAALKYNGYRLVSWLAEHFEKSIVHWKETQYVNVWGSVHWKGVYSVGEL